MKLQNGQLMIIQKLDKKLQVYNALAGVEIPSTGWVNVVRKVLNMSLRKLGQ